MTDLAEQFQNHRVHNGLTEARAKAEEARALAADDPDPAQVALGEAIVEAVRRATVELSAADGTLIDLSLVDNVAQSLDGIINNISAFETDAAVGLTGAHGEAVTLLKRVGELPITRTEIPAEVAEQASELIAQDVAAGLADLKRLQEAVSSSVAQSKALVDELGSQLAAHREALATAESSRAAAEASFAEEANKVRAEIAAVAAEVTSVRTVQDENYKATVANYESWQRSAQESVDARLEGIEALNKQAAEMMRNAGGAALGTSWKAGANRHLIERIIWSVLVVGILAGSVWVASEHLDELTAPAGSSFVDGLVFYIPRIPFAIITITTLGFAIQQASRRGQFEARDGRVGNELSSLPTFLERIPEGSRDALVQQIAANYFPGTELEHDVPPARPTGEPGTTFGLSHVALGGIAGNVVLAVIALYALSR